MSARAVVDQCLAGCKRLRVVTGSSPHVAIVVVLVHYISSQHTRVRSSSLSTYTTSHHACLPKQLSIDADRSHSYSITNSLAVEHARSLCLYAPSRKPYSPQFSVLAPLGSFLCHCNTGSTDLPASGPAVHTHAPSVVLSDAAVQNCDAPTSAATAGPSVVPWNVTRCPRKPR